LDFSEHFLDICEAFPALIEAGERSRPLDTDTNTHGGLSGAMDTRGTDKPANDNASDWIEQAVERLTKGMEARHARSAFQSTRLMIVGPCDERSHTNQA
jgi:hypothetical protein